MRKMRVLVHILQAFVFCKVANGFSQEFPCPFERRCTCINTTYLTANCSEKKLNHIPEIPKDLVNITLSFNRIIEVQNGTFKSNSTLQYLDLSHNEIRQLYSRSFDGLDNLKTLIIHSNNLIYSNISLRSVYAPLIELTTLDMKNNSDPMVEVDVSNLVTLETLKIDLIAEAKVYFGKKFSDLTNLKRLDLSGLSGKCKMQILTPDTFKYLSNLETLDLSKCRINVIWKGTFKNMHRLRYLDLSENRCLKLNGLENVTFDLPSTSIQELKVNMIHQRFELNVELKKHHIQHLCYTNLSKLYADSNRIQLIEKGAIQLLPLALKTLSLGDNQLSYGDYFDDIINFVVQSVNLSYNGMSHFSLKANEDCYPFQSNFAIEQYSGMPAQYKLQTAFSQLNSACGDDNCTSVISDYRCRSVRIQQKHVPQRKTKISDLAGLLDIVPIPYQLKKIYFKQSLLRSSVKQFKLSNNTVEYIDASSNTIFEWLGPILYLNDLKYLDLSFNFCSNISVEFLIGTPNLETFHAQNNLLGFVLPNDQDGKIFEPVKHLKNVSLAENRIAQLPEKIFKFQEELVNLNLSGNMLESVSFNIEHMQKLLVIDISNNRLPSLDNSFTSQLDSLVAVNPNLKVIMSGNPLKCFCDSIEFIQWLATTKVQVDISKGTCQSMNKQTMYFNNTKLIYSTLKKECSSYAVATFALTSAILLFLLILFCGITYRYRWKLRYIYYMVKGKHQGYIKPVQSYKDMDFLYDVFVSYAEEDTEFIHSKFLKHIEEEGNIICCLHKRDFTPGSEIATNITSAIHNCRKTTVIMSQNFLKSYWCMFEFNMARMESVYSRNNEDMILLVFLEQMSSKDLPLNVLELVQTQSYIEYPNDEYGDKVFWGKMKETLSQ